MVISGFLKGPRNAHGRRGVEISWSEDGGLVVREGDRSCLFGPEVVQALRDASPDDARPDTVTFAEGPTGTGPGRRIEADHTARITLTLTRKDEAGVRMAVVNVRRADGGLYNLRVPTEAFAAFLEAEEGGRSEAGMMAGAARREAAAQAEAERERTLAGARLALANAQFALGNAQRGVERAEARVLQLVTRERVQD